MNRCGLENCLCQEFRGAGRLGITLGPAAQMPTEWFATLFRMARDDEELRLLAAIMGERLRIAIGIGTRVPVLLGLDTIHTIDRESPTDAEFVSDIYLALEIKQAFLREEVSMQYLLGGLVPALSNPTVNQIDEIQAILIRQHRTVYSTSTEVLNTLASANQNYDLEVNQVASIDGEGVAPENDE